MRSFATPSSARATRRVSRRLDDRTVLLVMVGITVLILGGVALLSWTASRSAAPVESAAAVDSTSLLPLAAPVNPIVGGHDMNNMPDNSKIHPHTVAAGEP